MQPSSEPVPDEQPASMPARPSVDRATILHLVLLILVLGLGYFFRFRGVAWDEFQYLHPDERFLGFVENDIDIATSFREYFDTANSPLNPNNRGKDFFVYGTLPIFLLRYVLEALGKPGYANVAAI
ncbi:MAG: hypothetical protein HC806_09400, partial [Anaerolineae bacterium]|nr:hypothetical protein [Anaerolineae bacterium]